MNKILTLVAAGAIVATAACTKPAQEEAPQQKDIAIQLYSVRDILNGCNADGEPSEAYTDILNKLAAMGYTGIEAANYGGGKFYGRTPEQFAADLEAAGLKPVSSHVGHDLSAEELESGDFTPSLEWWKQTIADHKAAGMKYIVTPGFRVPDNLKDLKTYCDYFDAVGQMAAAEGIGYGYHNHAHEFNKVEGERVYDFMLQNTNPENVFYEMDVYWAVRGGVSPVEYFQAYPGRFKVLHVKDHKELGKSGMVGFDAIFANTDTAGVRDLIVEVEQYSMPVEQSVEESLDYLIAAPYVKASYAE